MKLILILLTFILSVYIFPACFIINHNHLHYINEHCETCIEMFSIVKAVSKIVRFYNIYNSVIIYLAISCIFFVKVRKNILSIKNNPTSLKVKLIN